MRTTWLSYTTMTSPSIVIIFLGIIYRKFLFPSQLSHFRKSILWKIQALGFASRLLLHNTNPYNSPIDALNSHVCLKDRWFNNLKIWHCINHWVQLIGKCIMPFPNDDSWCTNFFRICIISNYIITISPTQKKFQFSNWIISIVNWKLEH